MRCPPVVRLMDLSIGALVRMAIDRWQRRRADVARRRAEERALDDKEGPRDKEECRGNVWCREKGVLRGYDEEVMTVDLDEPGYSQRRYSATDIGWWGRGTQERETGGARTLGFHPEAAGGVGTKLGAERRDDRAARK